MSDSNFYQNQDLRYMEIGYNFDIIDRVQPGKISINIPVLTPQMDNSDKIESKIIQRDKSNIQNENADAIDVSDLEICNYISIEIPREIVAQPSGVYYHEGEHDYHSEIGYIRIQGVDSDMAGLSAGSGYDRDSHQWFDGTIEIIPTEPYRYIDKFKRWSIGFIGGDINMPFVVCKLPDS